MEYWKHTRLKFMNKRLHVYLVFMVFFCLCVTLGCFKREHPLESKCPLTSQADFPLQTLEKTLEQRNATYTVVVTSRAAWTRKLLGGPGSSPPRCISKCGRCTPCRPVHIPVPPGTPVTAEYYPEAWRCKCGNKLYMP